MWQWQAAGEGGREDEMGLQVGLRLQQILDLESHTVAMPLNVMPLIVVYEQEALFLVS